MAEAQRMRAEEPSEAAPASWIPSKDSPLGNRLTLEKCRSGEIESVKIGRKVLVRRSSLASYLEKRRRSGPAPPINDEDEDLFGAAS